MFSNHKYIAFETIVVKEVRRFSRIWLQTLVPPAITIGLYFVVFGNLIGRRIGDMGGFNYMEFILPGLIMMAVIQNSYSNVVSSFFSHKFQRSIEELLVSPVPNFIILGKFLNGLDQCADGQRAVLWADQKSASGGRGKGHSKL